MTKLNPTINTKTANMRFFFSTRYSINLPKHCFGIALLFLAFGIAVEVSAATSDVTEASNEISKTTTKARAQLEAQLEARTLAEQEVERLVRHNGPFDIALFEPLMALARLHLELDETDAAKDTLQRAQNIAHRNEGVYSPKQLVIIDQLTQLALDEQNYKNANQQQKFSFFVTTRDIGEQDPAVIAAYTDMADWYMFTGQPRRARRVLEEAMVLAEAFEFDPIPLAVHYNQARRLDGVCCNPKLLIQTLESASDSSVPDTLVDAYLELGDAMIIARKEDKAAEYFALAHELMPGGLSQKPKQLAGKALLPRRETGTRVDHRQFRRDLFDPRHPSQLEKLTEQQMIEDLSEEPAWFISDPNQQHLGFTQSDAHEIADRQKQTITLVGDPILFSEEQLDNLLTGRMKRERDHYSIELSFTVKANGDLDDISIVNSSAPVKIGRLMTEALKRLYYRPAIVDGVPVKRENVRLIQTFAPVERSLQP